METRRILRSRIHAKGVIVGRWGQYGGYFLPQQKRTLGVCEGVIGYNDAIRVKFIKEGGITNC